MFHIDVLLFLCWFYCCSYSYWVIWNNKEETCYELMHFIWSYLNVQNNFTKRIRTFFLTRVFLYFQMQLLLSMSTSSWEVFPKSTMLKWWGQNFRLSLPHCLSNYFQYWLKLNKHFLDFLYLFLLIFKKVFNV